MLCPMAPISVQTKLHILLLMLCVGITLYMYILYKEVRGFEKEIYDIKRQVSALAAVSPLPNVQVLGEGQTTVLVPTPPGADANANTTTTTKANADGGLVYENEDDDVSVTSNEIKEILTNIQDDDDVAEDKNNETHKAQEVPPAAPVLAKEAVVTPVPTPATAIATAETSNTPEVSVAKDDALAALTDDEVKSMKYDDVRNILRKRGIKFQGNKQEVISYVLKLRDEERAKK